MLPRLYTDLTDWYFLLSPPEEFAEEDEIYASAIIEVSSSPPRTLLELGSGGGCLASYFKHRFEVTLSDLSDEMLAISRTINPELEHIQGDLRTLRLGRQFDAVLIHDAIDYMLNPSDLQQAMQTAFEHCRPGGVALLAPDAVRETFRESTDCGGSSGVGRALRYLEWSRDPDPTDTTYTADFVLIMQEDGKPPRIEHDRHEIGLFSRDEWLGWLRNAGFEPSVHPLVHSEVEPGTVEYFVARRP